MNLYSTLTGADPDEILAPIGLATGDIERYRDFWIDEELGVIVVCTRTGGFNREAYPNRTLISNRWYIQDYDDLTDPTYAYYEFCIPHAQSI